MGAPLFLLAVLAVSPGVTEYERQSWSRHEVELRLDDRARISFSFLDDRDRPAQLEVTFELAWLQAQARRLGVPRFIMNHEAGRARALQRGLFRVDGDLIQPDGPAIVAGYDDVTRPVALELVKLLAAQNRDTRANRIALAIAFVEDIPYGIPPDDDATDWEAGGVISAPGILLEGYGDCDSKAFFLGGLLTALIGANDVAFVRPVGRRHVFNAIRQVPNAGQSFIESRNAWWVLADATGPARAKLGQVNEDFHRFTVEPLVH